MTKRRMEECSFGVRTVRLRNPSRRANISIQFHERYSLNDKEVEAVIKGLALELLIGKFVKYYDSRS